MSLIETDIAKYLAVDYPKHAEYPNTVQIAEAIQVHSRGNSPAHLLDLDRPNEDPKYKAYRTNKLLYSPKTKSKWGQISKTTDKIAMAEDWGIHFPEPLPTATGNTLEDYCTKDYPIFDSVQNWYFTVAKKKMEEDPNAVCVVYAEPTKNQTEYAKPIAYIYNSENVIDFVEGELCAILTKEKSIITVGQSQSREGDIYLFFDRETMIKAVQIGDSRKRTFEYTVTNHNIGYMPAFRLGGIIEKYENGQIIYKSFYDDAIPDFNEALARYSDHQVNMAMHLHPDRWEMATTPCKVCNGNGHLMDKGHKKGCTNCGGAGMVAVKTPFGVTTINPAVKIGVDQSAAIPTPPMGYANRPIESLNFLKIECNDLIQSGFNSLNLGFLNNEPEINSGIAKVMDRQELNAFFRTIARHIVENNLRPIFFFINEWRYPLLANRDKQMPIVTVPTRFDIISADLISQRLKIAIDGKFNPVLLAKLQVEYAENEFGKDSLEAKKIKTIFELDPLPSLTSVEKNELMLNSSFSGTDYESYVLSVNIYPFVERAINENKDFLDMDYAAKMGILEAYISEITAKKNANIIPMFNSLGETA